MSSTKRAVLIAKDCRHFSLQQQSFGSLNRHDNQYISINLNKFGPAKVLQFDSSISSSASNNNNKNQSNINGTAGFQNPSGFVKVNDYETTKKDVLCQKRYSTNNLYPLLQKEEKEWKNKTDFGDKNLSKSSLSLHIEAYENNIAIKAQNNNTGTKNFVDCDDLKASKKDQWVIPRQQPKEEEELMEAEVMAFKLSNRLMNFNGINGPTALPSRQLIRQLSTTNSNQNSSSTKEDSTRNNKKEPFVEVLKGKFKTDAFDITDKEKNPSYLKKIVPDVQKSIFGGRSSEPINWNFPNKKMEDSIVEELPLEDIVKDIPKITKKQYQLVKEEVTQYFDNPLEKPDLLNHFRGLHHGEAKIQYEFKDDKSMEIWNTGCDADWNQGFSRVEFLRTPRSTALFRGYINSEVVKDGKTSRAGWASIKSEDKKSFNRRKYLWQWKDYSHFLIKCRGDGRSYKVLLYVPGSIDVTWGDTYAYPLHTHGGPYWQYEKIPFSRFLHTVGMRVQDVQKPIIRQKISSVGITLMDRINGEFQLEIDYIGCYNDRSHEEKFAYETYTIPMFNPNTM